MSDAFKTHIRLPCGCIKWLFGSEPCDAHRPKGPRTRGWVLKDGKVEVIE